MPRSGSVQLEVPDLALALYQGADEIGGSDIVLSEIVDDGKPLVLNFYAALCPPCRAEMPEFQHAYESRGNEVTILGVDIGPQFHLGTREEGEELLEEIGVSYPAGTTFDETVVRGFQLVAMPTTLFIKADGRLLRAWSGPLNSNKINELIDELLES